MDEILEATGFNRLDGWFMDHWWRLLTIAVGIYVVVALLNRAAPFVLTAFSKRGRDPDSKQRVKTIAGAIAHTVDLLVVVAGLLLILRELEVDVAPLIAGVGVSSVAFGLAAQGIVRDYLRGIVLLAEHPYVVGDRVTIANVTGEVLEITLRHTTLRSDDGAIHTVGNGDVTVATRHVGDTSIIRLRVTVGYDADPAQVALLIDQALSDFAADEAWDGALEGQPTVGPFEIFDEVGGTMSIEAHVRDDLRWLVMSEISRRVREALSAANIPMPKVERFVHGRNNGDSAAAIVVSE